MANTTYTVLVRGIPITVAAITDKHYNRLQAVPGTIKPPPVPEGYTHEKALEHIESYGQSIERWNLDVTIERTIRVLGACRIAFASMPEFADQKKRELPAIITLCKQLTLPLPDTDDPMDCGQRIVDLYYDGNNERMIVAEFSLWANLSAGGIDPAKIEDAIKRLRSDLERLADPGSNGAPGTEGESEVSKPRRRKGKSASRSAQGGKRMGRPPKQARPVDGG